MKAQFSSLKFSANPPTLAFPAKGNVLDAPDDVNPELMRAHRLFDIGTSLQSDALILNKKATRYEKEGVADVAGQLRKLGDNLKSAARENLRTASGIFKSFTDPIEVLKSALAYRKEHPAPKSRDEFRLAA